MFKRGLIVSEYDQRDTEQLGDDTNQFAGVDIGKAVKFSGTTMVLCADGDEIVGVVESVEPYTNDGHSVGTVKKSGRAKVKNAGAGALAVGDLVVAAAQPALGTAGTAVKGGAPATYKWAVVWLETDGSVGSDVIIERV
ncbi:TPA: hypothetical protein NGR52_004192 [Vibrio parahaemolyticus]|nr:hypothetical protein [Vibrio parahaemolyticus]